MSDTAAFDNDRPDPTIALLDLAEALEANEAPDILEIKAALNGFRAAKLDKNVQRMVIEAREGAKNGRAPEASTLRAIAAALSGAPPAEAPKAKRGRPPGSRNKPKDVEIALERKAAVEAAPEKHMGSSLDEWLEEEGIKDEVDVAVRKRVVAEFHGAPVTMSDLPEQCDDTALLKAIFSPKHDDPVLESAAGGTYRASDLDPVAAAERREAAADRIVDTLTPAWRENVLGAPPNGNGHNGNGAAKVVRLYKEPLAEQLESIANRIYKEPPTEPLETPAELVARAADTIENGIPLHTNLVSELYELAAQLEANPPVDPSQEPLLVRVEREIERRIERALKSPGDLPAWVIEWARSERDRASLEGTY